VNRLEDAIRIALTIHEGQTDKAGQPYILHPLRVMLAGETEEERIVGVLHDCIEDADNPGEAVSYIVEQFGLDILLAVESVSRKPGEVYMDFIRRASQHPVGRKVKEYDLRDNLRPERLAHLPPDQRGVSKRYEQALAILNN
jgi:GTP diphosphokinase / guanosine-3',5'-bis(diphosphate) 3'-diphosphatase